ncbi:hypothetical protein HOD20_09530 [archaeon]|jgi:homoserine dehydrogenase|nr:hypothetical protein [archaeon]MBT4352750.1 hypothetical protein [archaeon]MBT4648153.1 hypothetical protein [archaeon]MBT6822429.1 hypothetical protein [archaeon]
MNNINLVQLGLGNVGNELIKQIINLNNKNENKKLNHICLVERDYFFFKKEGFSEFELIEILDSKKNNKTSESKYYFKKEDDKKIIDRIINEDHKNNILVDATAAPINELYLYALQNNFKITGSNKKPFCIDVQKYSELQKHSSQIKSECIIGAGLPILYVIESLVKTGDEIIEVNGCFSGTLGYIFSELEKEREFSVIIKKAKELGYTEPDPRDDLSGMDVARKALILARLMGRNIELENIKIENLVPEKLRKVSIEEFLVGMEEYDDDFYKKFQHAKSLNQTLRYVATISKEDIEVGIKAVDISSQIGALKGPDNICVIKSKRYSENPLVIQGPGAGLGVTADGILRNILELAGEQK